MYVTPSYQHHLRMLRSLGSHVLLYGFYHVLMTNVLFQCAQPMAEDIMRGFQHWQRAVIALHSSSFA